ncbi:M3 family oligoendopeptidase [candidate division GN15 bacterium]|nr:M3 family oligoendopeptidase [candidate division GN15 bacterium]
MTTTTQIPPAPTWDLDSVFPGGSDSREFAHYREDLKKDFDKFRTTINNLPDTLDDSTAPKWKEVILTLADLIDRLGMVGSFAHCLVAQNVKDNKAHAIEGEADEYMAEWQKFETTFQFKASAQPDAAWNKLLEDDDLKEQAFALNELRDQAKQKMAPELESLALDLSVNGYHAWNKLYDKMAGDLTVAFEEKGETRTLSLGQLATKMSDADRSIRAQAFEKMVEAWKTREDLAAMTLNALSGFRLSLYRNRSWDNFLHEALQMARIKQETLDAMWSAVADSRDKLIPYIDAKKKLLGVDKYAWYDQFAPCGAVDKLYSYDEAAEFIYENEKDFSKDMAEFAKMAIDKRWIEAEDRGGKAGGGYCTRFGPVQESRIFMTYANTYENLLTLAHELGHAYHGWVLKDKPVFAQNYPMTLAETASIFAELLVTDAALQACGDAGEKLMLLDQKIQASYTLFCDLRTRFLFESSFYKERKNGIVGASRLSELMIEAQKEAFGPMLDPSGYHPLFWCSKLHFYISEVPFYNFPYTFGYLFAIGVYDRARKEGSAFADKYRALLADTGSMTTEQVAEKHLGVDLTRPDFWKDATARATEDIDEFVRLAGEVK